MSIRTQIAKSHCPISTLIGLIRGATFEEESFGKFLLEAIDEPCDLN